MVTEKLSDVSESEGGIFSGKKRKTPEKSNRLQVRAVVFKSFIFFEQEYFREFRRRAQHMFVQCVCIFCDDGYFTEALCCVAG